MAGEAAELELVRLTGEPRLGVVRWLWDSILHARGLVVWPGDVAGAHVESACERLRDGADVVLAGRGEGPAHETSRAELIMRPARFGLLAADAERLRGIELPEALARGAPDTVLDDHAAWAIGVCASSRVRVDRIGEGPAPVGDGVTARGAAWLVQQALGWAGASLRGDEIEAMLGRGR